MSSLRSAPKKRQPRTSLKKKARFPGSSGKGFEGGANDDRKTIENGRNAEVNEPIMKGGPSPGPSSLLSEFNYRFESVEDHVAALNADPLGQLKLDLIDCGLEPVLSAAKLIYLAKASPYAGRHVSLQIRGDSESFKSMTVSLVARLHPETDIIVRQNITWAALMEGLGCGNDLRRRVICLDENVESRKRDHDLMGTIRELTTKECVTRSKMQRGVPQNITLLGPAAIIDCMLTDTVLTDQDVNRFLVISMPEDPAVRTAVCQLNAERFDDRGARRNELINRIAKGHQALLGQFKKEIIVNKPALLSGSNESPRFDSSVFGLVCTTAWLHQSKRINEAGGFTATADDYAYVHNLLKDVRILFPKSSLTGSATKYLQAWRDLAMRQGNLPISSPQLHAAIAPNMDPGAFGRVINELIKANYAEPTGRGPRGVKFQQLTDLGLTYSGSDLISKLPSPESLREAQACATPRIDQSQE